MAEFVCWSADDETEDDARPAWKQRYEWERQPYLSDSDFERAAEIFAERVHSDWDYPDSLELFVMNTEAREVRFVKVNVESGGPSFDANADSEEGAMRLFLYRYTAPARAAMEHRPRPWNWREQRWERLHPEEAKAKKAAAERARKAAIEGKSPWPAGSPPADWSAVVWPEWMPEKVRDSIIKWGRTPRQWEDIFAYSGGRMPHLGERMTLETWSRTFVTGRFVPMPNEQGEIVDDAGVVHRVHSRRTSLTPEEVAAKELAWRTERLRKEAAKAVETANADALEFALRVLSEAKSG